MTVIALNIATMNVSPADKAISINGEGYICEALPALDPNIVSLHWEAGKQGRCKGHVRYHKGGGHGVEDFVLFEPFVPVWQAAKAAKESKLKAAADAREAKRLERTANAEKAREAAAAQAEQAGVQQTAREAQQRRQIAADVVAQLGGKLPEGATAALPPDPQIAARISKVESDAKGLLDLVKTMIDQKQIADKELAEQLGNVKRLAHLNHLFLLALEASSDPAPTLAKHPIIGQALNLTRAADGDAKAWAAAIKAFKESAR